MRRSLILLAIALIVLAPFTAGAQPSGAKANRGEVDIDISAYRDQLEVVSDGDGHYLAINALDNDIFFYGDGKTMFAQTRTTAFFGGDPVDRSLMFWSPRTNGRASINHHTTDGWSIDCADRKTKMLPTESATARRVVEQARFVEPRWRRRSLALARDERGVFYYVDRLDPRFGVGFRLFTGKKGRLVEKKLLDIIDDSVGMVFYTAAGALWIDHAKGEASWRRGRRREPLAPLRVDDNGSLIWDQLGVYRSEILGNPCDDL